MSKDICEDHGRIRCDICAYISELKEQASIAELAYQGLAEIAVTRGEYQSLLDKHSLLSRAYRTQRDYLNKLEAREQKLRELITEILGDTTSLDYLNREKTQRLVEGYLSLYSEEATQ